MKDNKLATLILSLMALGLLIYTGSRTVDLISITLPLDQQALAYVALVAFDGGLIGWTWYYLKGAKGAWQRAIAIAMIFVSLAGVIIAFMGDTLYQSAQRGALTDLPSGLVLTVIIGLGAVISINIAAFIGIQITDPTTRKEQAAQEAQDEIEEAAIAQIRASSKMLATELAPRLGQAWVDEMRARYGAALPGPAPARPALPEQKPTVISQPETLEAKDENPLELAETSAPTPNGNGRTPKS